ncbi:Putative cytoplasmic protein [Citrobacter portucalensis]|nr:Putative cytoplasmic protein [Citrobacter portucalensis]
MRALLKPVVARELGIVLLKPGSELMSLFSCERVLVESQPAGMERLPAGRVPDVRQPLACDESLRPFFLDEKVIKVAGGLSGLDYWLLRYGGSCCQWPHSDYHYHELTTLRHEPGSVLLCGHCDNHLRDHYSEQLAELARCNVISWIINSIMVALNQDLFQRTVAGGAMLVGGAYGGYRRNSRISSQSGASYSFGRSSVSHA